MVTSQGVRANAKILVLLSVLTAVFISAGYTLGGTSGVLIAVVIAGVMNFGSYWFSDKLVLRMYRAEKVSESDNPELHKIVEELSEKAGIPKPEVYKTSMSISNAFATGRSPEHGVVCVTDGLMKSLDSDEVAGVIAHELAHIKNRDTLVNAVVATIAGALGFLAEMVFWTSLFGREEDSEALSAIAFMILTPIIALLIRTAVSRSMEFRADSQAVKIHGNREGLKSALRKINAEAKGYKPRHISKSQEAGANLFIENPFSSDKVTRFFSTHPPLENRIENIDSTEL